MKNLNSFASFLINTKNINLKNLLKSLKIFNYFANKILI